MICPKCGHIWKDEGRSKGGRTSRRTLSAEQAREMTRIRDEKKRKGDTTMKTSDLVRHRLQHMAEAIGATNDITTNYKTAVRWHRERGGYLLDLGEGYYTVCDEALALAHGRTLKHLQYLAPSYREPDYKTGRKS